MQLRTIVVELEFAVVASVREVEPELHLRAMADVGAEIGPFRRTVVVSLFELLQAILESIGQRGSTPSRRGKRGRKDSR